MPEITRHVLKSDGAWVDLRDPSLIRAGERKAAMAKAYAAARASGGRDTEEGISMENLIEIIEASTEFAEIVAASIIAKWFIPELHEAGPVIPDRRNLAATVADMQDLTSDDYDRLLELATPAIDLLRPRGITPDDVDDPASPSEPASE
jgi:uncharacterized membrane-anchored protein